jgi:hypothetical protein
MTKQTKPDVKTKREPIKPQMTNERTPKRKETTAVEVADLKEEA